MSHTVGGLKSWELIPSQFWRLKSVIMMSARPWFLQGSTEGSFQASVASDKHWQSWLLLGLWQHNSNLCLHIHMLIFPLSVFRSKFSSFTDTSYYVSTHLDPVWPHLKVFTSTKTLFWISSHSQFWVDIGFSGTLFNRGWSYKNSCDLGS